MPLDTLLWPVSPSSSWGWSQNKYLNHSFPSSPQFFGPLCVLNLKTSVLITQHSQVSLMPKRCFTPQVRACQRMEPRVPQNQAGSKTRMSQGDSAMLGHTSFERDSPTKNSVSFCLGGVILQPHQWSAPPCSCLNPRDKQREESTATTCTLLLTY